MEGLHGLQEHYGGQIAWRGMSSLGKFGVGGVYVIFALSHVNFVHPSPWLAGSTCYKRICHGAKARE